MVGRKWYYTPDVLVQYKTQNQVPTLFEVKYRSDLQKNWSDLKPKFKAAIRYCKETQWRFKIITEVEIRTTTLKSVTFLSSYVNGEYISGLSRRTQAVLSVLPLDDIVTIAELQNKLSSDPWMQAEYTPAIWHLIATGKLYTDLSVPLTMASSIRRGNGEQDEY